MKTQKNIDFTIQNGLGGALSLAFRHNSRIWFLESINAYDYPEGAVVNLKRGGRETRLMGVEAVRGDHQFNNWSSDQATSELRDIFKQGSPSSLAAKVFLPGDQISITYSPSGDLDPVRATMRSGNGVRFAYKAAKDLAGLSGGTSSDQAETRKAMEAINQRMIEGLLRTSNGQQYLSYLTNDPQLKLL